MVSFVAAQSSRTPYQGFCSVYLTRLGATTKECTRQQSANFRQVGAPSIRGCPQIYLAWHFASLESTPVINLDLLRPVLPRLLFSVCLTRLGCHNKTNTFLPSHTQTLPRQRPAILRAK